MSIFSIANWSPKVGEDKVATGMQQAFNIWSKYSSLRFVRVYDPDADIIVAFGSGYHGDQYPFDGPGNVLAHAFYPYEPSSFGGDIHFDDDENWKENAAQLQEGNPSLIWLRCFRQRFFFLNLFLFEVLIFNRLLSMSLVIVWVWRIHQYFPA